MINVQLLHFPKSLHHLDHKVHKMYMCTHGYVSNIFDLIWILQLNILCATIKQQVKLVLHTFSYCWCFIRIFARPSRPTVIKTMVIMKWYKCHHEWLIYHRLQLLHNVTVSAINPPWLHTNFGLFFKVWKFISL